MGKCLGGSRSVIYNEVSLYLKSDPTQNVAFCNSLNLYYMLNSTWINLGNIIWLILPKSRAGVFQGNFSSIYSNIHLVGIIGAL